jgi:hypothetical protein
VTSLLVIVSTRNAKENCERLLKSFDMNTDDADLVFVTDGDDDAYEDMDWGAALHAELDPRDCFSGKLNQTALACADDYDALMVAGDDHVFRTRHWDTLMLARLTGSGIVYPDTRTQATGCWLVSSDIVKALDWIACPAMQQYHLGDAIGELGKRAGLNRACPEVIVEQLLPGNRAGDVLEMADFQAYQQWRGAVMPHQVALLRRAFNPDVQWVLSTI